MTDTVCTVSGAIAAARARGIDRLDAQLLLAHQLGRNRAWLLAHGEDALAAEHTQAYAESAERRACGVPLAYLTGVREFHGLPLRITPDVLVPRPETETLVDWALELLAGPLREFAYPRVIDLGTGSGAIALAVKRSCPRAEVIAVDNSPAALQVADGNALRLGLRIQLLQSEWWQAVPEGPLHLALGNPPYIAEDDAHLPSLQHEPRQALVSGREGLDDIRRIVNDAHAHLEPGAWVLLEHGFEQAGAVRNCLTARGFVAAQTRKDLSGHERCTGACRP
jgi:release factor glutamine methyltransferase